MKKKYVNYAKMRQPNLDNENVKKLKQRQHELYKIVEEHHHKIEDIEHRMNIKVKRILICFISKH